MVRRIPKKRLKANIKFIRKADTLNSLCKKTKVVCKVKTLHTTNHYNFIRFVLRQNSDYFN